MTQSKGPFGSDAIVNGQRKCPTDQKSWSFSKTDKCGVNVYFLGIDKLPQKVKKRGESYPPYLSCWQFQHKAPIFHSYHMSSECIPKLGIGRNDGKIHLFFLVQEITHLFPDSAYPKKFNSVAIKPHYALFPKGDGKALCHLKLLIDNQIMNITDNYPVHSHGQTASPNICIKVLKNKLEQAYKLKRDLFFDSYVKPTKIIHCPDACLDDQYITRHGILSPQTHEIFSNAIDALKETLTIPHLMNILMENRLPHISTQLIQWLNPNFGKQFLGKQPPRE